MLNLAEAFRDRGADVDVVVGSAVGELTGHVPPGIRLVDLGAPRVLFAVLPLARYLRRRRSDVVIASLGHANVATVASRLLSGARTKVILTEHLAIDDRAAGIGDQLFRWLARAFYPRADAIVAVSNGVADSFSVATGIPRDSIDVIYNPVLTPAYWRSVRTPASHPWFADGSPPVVLGVGRLMPQKDFPLLVRAFARLRASGMPARLMILGEGPERDAIVREVEQNGLTLDVDVALPGFVAPPYPMMAAAGVFVLSSRREGLPTVLIEALAAGVPVVSTDCESGPREILAGGRYGALVPVGDEEALARAIAAALTGRRGDVDPDAWRAYTPEAAAQAYWAAAGLDGDRHAA